MQNNTQKSQILFFLIFCYLVVTYYYDSLFSLLLSIPIILGTWSKSGVLKNSKSKQILFFLNIPLLIGLLSFDFHSVLRDLMIFINPLITIALGYAIASYTNYLNFIKFVLFCALFYSLQYLIFFDFNSISNSIYEIRNVNIRPNYFTVLGLAFIIVEFKTLRSHYSINYLMILIILFSFALVLSVSRAFIFAPLIFIITQGIITRKAFVIGFVLLIPFLFILSGVFNQSSLSNTGPLQEFIDKTFNISEEVKVKSYSSQEEINKNWRGFESFRALISFSDFPLSNKVFGAGFGHKVELGYFQKLDDKFYSEIPIMHNGYLMVLTKTGIFGLVFFLLIIILPILKFILKRLTNKKNISKPEILLFGMSMLIFLGTFTAGGWFHRSEFIPLIFSIGGLLRFIKKENESNSDRLSYF